MVSHFRPLLLPARARGTHFLLPLGSVILQLGVPQATVKAGWPAAFPRLATEKGSRWAVVAVSFVARSLPGIGRSFPVGLSGSQTCLGTADLAIPFDLFAAADPALAAAVVVGPAAVVVAAAGPAFSVGPAVSVDLAAAVGSDFAFAADLVCPVDSACSFSAVVGEWRAVFVLS